jgi:hypothetical protein
MGQLPSTTMRTVINGFQPPPLNPQWLNGFMQEFKRQEPGVPALIAIEHAVAAFELTWLLEPDEACDLWCRAVRNHAGLPPD